MVTMNSGRSSAELEQVSAIWPKRTDYTTSLVCCVSNSDAAALTTTTCAAWDSLTVVSTMVESLDENNKVENMQMETVLV